MISLQILKAQDISKIAESKPISFTGGINATSTIYQAFGMDSRRDPFAYVLNANLNFNFYGIVDAPFSAYIAKNNKTYTQPSYNQYGISPKYKSITLHLGHRNLSYSAYSLSGVTFLGAGIDYAPEKKMYKASAMYGRFTKAVAYDSINPSLVAYERWGWSSKITLGQEKNNFGVIIFKSSDKPNSINIPLSNMVITPEENFIVGVQAKNTITKRIKLQTEYTMSALTKDMRAPKRVLDEYTYANNLGRLYTPRYSSTFNNAIMSNIDYSADKFTIGMGYKRVEPEYRSHGATFLTNDIQDIVLNFSTSLFNNKIGFSSSIGQQNNNLNKDLLVTSKQLIGSANINYVVNAKLNLSASWSNFSSATEPGLVSIKDTMHFAQVSENKSIVINYNFGENNVKHNLSMNNSLQNANTLNETAEQVVESNTEIYNGSISYNLSFLKSKTGLMIAASYNEFTQSEGGTSIAFGPSMGVNQNLYKDKVSVNISHAFQQNRGNHAFLYNLSMSRFGAGLKIDKQSNLRFNASFMNKKSAATDTKPNERIQELLLTLTYSYLFK